MMTLPGKRDVMYLDEATLKSIEHLMFQLTIGLDPFRKAKIFLKKHSYFHDLVLPRDI